MRQSEDGASPAPGIPRLIEVGERMRIGGRFDTVTRQFVGECKRWRVWLVGEKQADILREYIDGSARVRNRLLYSAEGAGKTVLMAMFVWVQLILAATASMPGCLGATAPTSDRLGSLINAVCDLAPVDNAKERNPHAWGTLFVDARELRTIGGQIVQFRSTKKQSGATGSPVQGYTWNLGAAMDEAQDQVEQGAYEDVVARLRGGTTPPIMATATAKDSPAWRTWRDSLSDNWTIERLRYNDTPFVAASHWEFMQRECTAREWRRRGLAEDCGPERMLYHTWQRSLHVRPIPHVGAEDVTEEVLERFGRKQRILVGIDPGELYDVSCLLKAYRLRGEELHRWWIVGEVTTKRSTKQAHVLELLTLLRKFNCHPAQSLGKPHLRIDPTADPEIYMIFRDAGLNLKPATYKERSSKAGRIPKESRIDMLCTLLLNQLGATRLHVATDEHGRPVAPGAVRSFETSQRDVAEQAETERKGERDVSHWTTNVGYALWSLERPRITEGGAVGLIRS